MATYHSWSFLIGSNHRNELEVSLLKRTYDDGREVGYDLVYLARPTTVPALESQVGEALQQAIHEWFGEHKVISRVIRT